MTWSQSVHFAILCFDNTQKIIIQMRNLIISIAKFVVVKEVKSVKITKYELHY